MPGSSIFGLADLVRLDLRAMISLPHFGTRTKAIRFGAATVKQIPHGSLSPPRERLVEGSENWEVILRSSLAESRGLPPPYYRQNGWHGNQPRPIVSFAEKWRHQSVASSVIATSNQTMDT